MKNPIPFLRTVGLVEAGSFIVLVAIAMPLKYFAGLPVAVKIAGSIHGALFMALCLATSPRMATPDRHLQRRATAGASISLQTKPGPGPIRCRL
jgi:integral membrane protein